VGFGALTLGALRLLPGQQPCCLSLGGRLQLSFEESQKTNHHIGAIVRLNRERSAPEDNPYVGQEALFQSFFTASATGTSRA